MAFRLPPAGTVKCLADLANRTLAQTTPASEATEEDGPVVVSRQRSKVRLQIKTVSTPGHNVTSIHETNVGVLILASIFFSVSF